MFDRVTNKIDNEVERNYKYVAHCHEQRSCQHNPDQRKKFQRYVLEAICHTCMTYLIWIHECLYMWLPPLLGNPKY